MEITDIQVYLTPDDGPLKAYVVMVLEDSFVVRDIKVIEGHSGLFVAMPAKKQKDGSFKDIAHPLNKRTRDEMQEKILAAFRAKRELMNGPSGA